MVRDWTPVGTKNDPPCNRCGGPTVMAAGSGATYCPPCRRRDHREVLAFFSVDAALAEKLGAVADPIGAPR